jgi:prepilin-type N-terminal cleavage/methylation domain-containing protein
MTTSISNKREWEGEAPAEPLEWEGDAPAEPREWEGDAPAEPRRTNIRLGRSLALPQRKGFTLLEIVISLAILAGSLAALGEVMRLADHNAQMVRDESQAQILASSVMDELLSGSRATQAVNQELFDYNTDPPWLYSIAFDQTPYVELLLARVHVEQKLPPEQQPAHFELVRWVPNPDYVTSSTSQQSSSSTGSTGSSSQSSSSFGTSGTGAQTSGGQQ